MRRRQFNRIITGIGFAVLPMSRMLAGEVAAGNHFPDRKTGIVLDKLFLKHQMGAGHPESPLRIKTIISYLERGNFLVNLQNLPIRNNIEPYLLSVHTPEHIKSINELYPESYPVTVSVVGAALSAVDAVCTGVVKNVFCATRPPGHHATNTGKEEGFCFFNAVAVAARYAQSQYGLKRILIVDWDYHHGNGTESAFYSDPSVLFFSSHDFYAYPGTGDPARRGEGRGKGYNMNVHLDCGATDKDIVTVFEKKLLPFAGKFKPDLILISAGFDSRKDDLLGCFDITDEGFVTLTEMMMYLAGQHCNGRLVSILEGGYNPKGLASSVKAHVATLNNNTGI